MPRQGRIGIGSAALRDASVAAASEPSLTVGEVDRAITEIEAMSGAGSAAGRRQRIGALFSQATDGETTFLRRLLTGELRQGALAGLMADAVAKAASVPELARRALMLSGDLTELHLDGEDLLDVRSASGPRGCRRSHPN